MASYVGSRFGQDGPNRIVQTTDLLLEATEMPTEPRYQTSLSFLPANIVSGSDLVSGAAADDAEHKQYPDRLDLFCWQGDDFVVPLYFKDPNQPTLDMSTWKWKAQVRTQYAYNGRWVYDMAETTELIPAAETEDGLYNQTLVHLFLPRQTNRFRGVFWWELQTQSPYTGPSMVGVPKPEEVPAADWPPTTQVKTWLYGKIYVVPRLTSTDVLPLQGAVSNGSTLWVTPEGWVAGPNGRVP